MAGINDGLIKISVSIEDIYEIIEDLDQALRAAIITDIKIMWRAEGALR